MNNWLICVPGWGKRCVDSMRRYALPAIRLATASPNRNIRWLIHTDQREVINALGPIGGMEKHILPVPQAPSPHHALGLCHKQALEMARNGERVALLCADMVPSVEAFDAADKRFNEGKKLIMCAATRTFNGVPPIGAKSRDLLTWTMDNKHPMIDECFFGHGKISCPWAVYFSRGKNIVLHGLHLHPFAMIKDTRNPAFAGATIDFDLAAAFSHDEIHLVTDPDELSFAELSPAERIFPLISHPFHPGNIAVWAHRHTIPIHRWFFKQPIIIRGDTADIGQMGVVEQILQQIEELEGVI